jgi:hypothetical protein
MKLFSYGCEPQTFFRDWMFFVSIQAIIFVKVVAFFIFFGHGISYYGQPIALNIPFITMPVFANLVQVWEYFFHQLMHALIAVWMFLLVKHMKVFDGKGLVKLFFIATILHNVGYWFTAAHPSISFSIRDFLTDYLALVVFFGIFWVMVKLFPALKKWKIPFFD